MEREVYVYLDLDMKPVLIGKLWSRVRKESESASFEYDRAWQSDPNFFSIEPSLMGGIGQHHTQADKKIFGALGDSAPDRWGRVLMRRAERLRAKEANQPPRTLFEIDYLLNVNDEARMGALRFSTNKNGPFLADKDHQPIPPLIDLPRLLAAANHLNDDSYNHEDLALLLAPGSSLGGARPKASVRNTSGDLLIAKFPSDKDEYSVVLWEALALSLAKKCGIEIADFRVEKILNKPVLLSKRFDRIGKRRIPFLSGMSMLSLNDNDSASYLEMADAIRAYGASPIEDLHQLWRRILFNVMIANTDDHLRNHAFLFQNLKGWRLSPAYDLNPVPMDIKPRILTLNIDEYDGEGTIEHVLSVAEYFELNSIKALSIVNELKNVISHWRSDAKTFGLSPQEIERMSSAFIGIL